MAFLNLVAGLPIRLWDCCGQNVFDALENDRKANFQENFPGNVQFQSRWWAMTPCSLIPPSSDDLGCGIKMWLRLRVERESCLGFRNRV